MESGFFVSSKCDQTLSVEISSILFEDFHNHSFVSSSNMYLFKQ